MNHGFVIWAECEAQARALANERCGDEGAVWDNPSWPRAWNCRVRGHPGDHPGLPRWLARSATPSRANIRLRKRAHIGHSDRQVTGHFDAPLPGQADQCPHNISSAPRDAPALAVDRRRGRVLLLGAADAKSVSLSFQTSAQERMRSRLSSCQLGRLTSRCDSCCACVRCSVSARRQYDRPSRRSMCSMASSAERETSSGQRLRVWRSNITFTQDILNIVGEVGNIL